MAKGLMKGFKALRTPAIESYLQTVGFRPHPVKEQLIKATHDQLPQWENMLIPHIQADFLGLLARPKAQRSVWKWGLGSIKPLRSASCPADGEVDAFDVSEEFTEIARDWLGWRARLGCRAWENCCRRERRGLMTALI